MRISFPSRAVRGFSMVELMVAMAIGLIGTIIIFQVFEVSEGIRRTTSSGGDAQQNGAISLYVMEKDLRNSGMGFSDTGFAGCNIKGYDSSRGTPNFPVAPATMTMVPVQIVSGAATTAPDQISMFYGSQFNVADATYITANMTAATDPLTVANRYGYRTGDLVLVYQPGAPATNCVLMEVTGIPAAVSAEVDHITGVYQYLPSTGAPVTVTSRFNPAAGMGVAYNGAGGPNAARIYNLGNIYDTVNGGSMPVYNTYAIDANHNLTVASGFSQNAATAVADNVVHMRALYGLDDGVNNGTVTYNATYAVGDGIVDRFVDASAAPNWQYVIAIKLAVVARSALPEIPAAGKGQPCDTTVAEPTWSGTVWSAAPQNFKTRLDVSASVAAPDSWQCYRYKVFETTIPLRNWIWKSS